MSILLGGTSSSSSSSSSQQSVLIALGVAGVSLAMASLASSLFQYYVAKEAKGGKAPPHRRTAARRQQQPQGEQSDHGGPVPVGPGESATESQHLLNLLYSIAEDQARKEGYVHRGICCNHCNITPIRGLRFKCANCVDYDLCEACEAVEPHVPRTHVFLKIRIPIPPLANPRTALTPVLYPGVGKALNESILSWEDLRELQKKTHFDHVELEALYDQFKSLAPSAAGISWRIFEHCLGPLGLERNLITERIFDFFDQDGDGIINFSELVCGLSILCKGSQEEKILYIFKGYDLDNDGFINIQDLEKMFRAYFRLSFDLIKNIAKALQDEIVLRYDQDSDKPVSAAFTSSIPSEDGRAVGKTAVAATPVVATPGGDAANSSFRWPTPQQIKPLMDSLSDEAITELVHRTFKGADPRNTGLISFEAFKKVALADPTVTAWFEALGTVF